MPPEAPISASDARQDEAIANLGDRLAAHEAHCERRQAAVWTELGKMRTMLWAVLVGIALLLGGEAGIMQAVLGLAQ